MFIFVALIICLALYIFGTTMYLSATSTGPKTLPPVQVTSQTRRGTAEKVKFCPKCGADFEDKPFCAACGTSAQIRQTFRLPIQGSITAQKAETMVNNFLAQNPYIADCRMKIDYDSILMFPFVQLRFRVKAVELSCVLSDKPQAHRYGMAFLYKYRLFGPIGYNGEKLVAQWAGNNRDCAVISHTGSRIQHFSNQGNFEAHYYQYVFFKKKI